MVATEIERAHKLSCSLTLSSWCNTVNSSLTSNLLVIAGHREQAPPLHSGLRRLGLLQRSAHHPVLRISNAGRSTPKPLPRRSSSLWWSLQRLSQHKAAAGPDQKGEERRPEAATERAREESGEGLWCCWDSTSKAQKSSNGSGWRFVQDPSWAPPREAEKEEDGDQELVVKLPAIKLQCMRRNIAEPLFTPVFLASAVLFFSPVYVKPSERKMARQNLNYFLRSQIKQVSVINGNLKSFSSWQFLARPVVVLHPLEPEVLHDCNCKIPRKE